MQEAYNTNWKHTFQKSSTNASKLLSESIHIVYWSPGLIFNVQNINKPTLGNPFSICFIFQNIVLFQKMNVQTTRTVMLVFYSLTKRSLKGSYSGDWKDIGPIGSPGRVSAYSAFSLSLFKEPFQITFSFLWFPLKITFKITVWITFKTVSKIAF